MVGIPVTLDYPDGVFLLKVKLQYAKRISRTIAIRTTQTLEDLHMAILDAFDWDNDHLYSFFLYGKRGEDPDARVVGPWEYDHGDTEARCATTELHIGAIGLIVKHTFRYLFDYGDMHEFEIDVVGMQEQAEPGDYPRIGMDSPITLHNT